ncbi:tail fiber protein [Paenibacillus amylolyticus]|uniref:Phage protein n=1 Tax=Paenibacillus amylolyticus TaxID=1451 RepID=A0A100VHQ9_PAEAM|nr:tail fiber protein [Paenibacillus amylolyticus]GAS80068.1 phage protein [Paenibacillus amylolyticus]
MPKETDRLKLPLPLGNENVTRESINGIFEKIDAGVATRESILIPAESDLNSYITEGEYYCPTNATVGTLANSPVGVAFHLTIEKHAGVVQTLTTFEPSNLQVFQRNYYVGWGPWKKVPTRDDIEEVKVYTDQKLGEIIINDASLTDKGIVQLSNAVDGTREDLAATEKAVRDAATAAETNAKNASLPRTGGDISGPLTVNSWGSISAGTSGFFLMGHNCYIHPTNNKYYYKQTHSNLGARGIIFRLGQVGVYTFETGPIPTVKDTEFTPTLVRMSTQTDYDVLFQSVSDGKAVLETAITDKGGTVLKLSGVPTYAELNRGISSIPTVEAGKFGDGKHGELVLNSTWPNKGPAIIPGEVGNNHSYMIDGLTSTSTRFENIPSTTYQDDSNKKHAFTIDLGGGFPILRRVTNISFTYRFVSATTSNSSFVIQLLWSDDNYTWSGLTSLSSNNTNWTINSLSLSNLPAGARYIKAFVYQGSSNGSVVTGEIQEIQITYENGSSFYASGGFEAIECTSFTLETGATIRYRPIRGLVIFSKGDVVIRGNMSIIKGFESGVPVIWPLMTNYGDTMLRGGAGGAGGGRLLVGSPGGRLFGGGFGEGGVGGSGYAGSNGSWPPFRSALQRNVKMISPDAGGGLGGYSDGNIESYAWGGAGGGGQSIGFTSWEKYSTYRGGKGGNCYGGGGGGGGGASDTREGYSGGDGGYAGGYFGIVCAGDLTITSQINASGGNGGVAGAGNGEGVYASSGGTGGGGAGGGVLTFFYNKNYKLTGSLLVNGGIGGAGVATAGSNYVTQAGGNGLAGTIVVKKLGGEFES